MSRLRCRLATVPHHAGQNNESVGEAVLCRGVAYRRAADIRDDSVRSTSQPAEITGCAVSACATISAIFRTSASGPTTHKTVYSLCAVDHGMRLDRGDCADDAFALAEIHKLQSLEE